MLENGFTSGCLTVISNDFQSNYHSFLQNIKPLALREWNRFDAWEIEFLLRDEKANTFDTYYKLNKTEKKLFDNKSEMPSSYIEKYFVAHIKKNSWYIIDQLPCVLYHNKKPYTKAELVGALKSHKVYKVKCNICNRIFYMDEASISCVKWRSCIGAACLSSTITNEDSSFTNLCKIDNHNKPLQEFTTQLSAIESLSNPLSYYGGFDDLHISYISDIHLLHHLRLNDSTSLNSLVNATIRNLYDTMDDNSIIVFGGDISSDATLTVEFYKRFVQYNDYLTYLQEKDVIVDLKNKKTSIDINKQNLEIKIARIKEAIGARIELLSPYLDFEDVVHYKKRFRKDSLWVDAISTYKNVASYKSKGISNECDGYLDLIASKLDLLKRLEFQYEECLYTIQELLDFEAAYGKKIDEITISDVYSEHHLLSEEREIFVVLGNHEYIGFDKVEDAIDYYSPRLEALGIKLLHNSYYEYKFNGKTCVIFGGSGFAKYNTKYNADTLVGCNCFTRQEEIIQSSLFEEAYKKAKRFANDKSCFVCVSHYPIRDCSASIDNDTIYFYGHNHQNYYHRNENEIIYADNQIGYENCNIAFKTMTTGVVINPYFALEDGLYKTTIKDYLQFYRHIGESIGDGSLLYQRCQNNKASMYVIKRRGYYGFFIMNPNKGESKGISIVNGGKTKKITKSIDLQWLFDNFEIVLCKYLQVLTPLRMYQEQISNELKQLDFSGMIHGCIVDVDFYHHIMLNPTDGTMTFYYSSSLGSVLPLKRFEDVIKSVQSHDVGLFSSKRDYGLLLQQFNEKKQDQNYLLGKVKEANLLEARDNDIVADIDENEQTISLTDSVYSISRRINPLQRLFTCHTLRDFDMRLVEAEPSEI